MSGNARFHDKLHRANHHTLSTSGLLDSAYDPIASPEYPFQGDFILNGDLSAAGTVIAKNLNIQNEIIIDGNSTTQNQTIIGSLRLAKQNYGGTAIYAQNAATNPNERTLSINYENGVFVSNDLTVYGTITGNFPSINGITPNTRDISIAYVTLSSNSASWNNVYSTVNTNSATTWNYQGTDLKALSSNWESTYNTFKSTSGNFLTTETNSQTLSYSEPAKISISNGNTVSLSSLDVRSLSSNWQNTYSTVSANSGNWLSKSGLVSAASANFTNLSSNYITLKSYTETSTSLTSPGSPAIYNIDLTQGTVFQITLTTNVGIAYGGGFTLQNIPSGVNSFLMILTQSNVGNVLVSFDFIGKTVKWSGGAPTVTSTANATDIYSFMSVDGNTWYGSVAGKNFI